MIKTFAFIIALIMPVVAMGDIFKVTYSYGDVYYKCPEHGSDRYKRILKSAKLKSAMDYMCEKKKHVTKSQINATEKFIKNSLNDPYSAHFKWPKEVSIKKDDITYCAFVNYKNQFGGYVGYTPFSVILIESKKGWKVKGFDVGDGVECSQIDDDD